MFKKKNAAPGIERTIAKAVDFELTIAELARRSERRAWAVAFGAIAMSLILAGGYFYMLPLKERVPFLVMADAYTGTSTVARLTDDIAHQRITASEAINRSNVAHFVLARESYDLALTNLRDWTTVLTMSGPGVAATYTALHSSLNPDSPYKVYGQHLAVRVKILSIVLLKADAGATPQGATVRFQRSLYDKRTGATRPIDSKIATLEFTYKAHLKMDERYRVENPLGFQVTSYRVDSDYASAPPEESPGRPVLPSRTAGRGGDAPDLVIPPPPGAELEPAAATEPVAPAAPPAVHATPRNGASRR